MPQLKYVNIKSLGWKIKFVKFVKLRLRNLVPTDNDTVKMKLIRERKLLPIFFLLTLFVGTRANVLPRSVIQGIF